MPQHFVTVADYARQVFPHHLASGGDELCVDGHTVVALYTEPGKAVRVLETAGHEFGFLELALVRLETRDHPAPPSMALAAVRAVGRGATTGVVALMERFEPESVRIVGADGWWLPESSAREPRTTSPS